VEYTFTGIPNLTTVLGVRADAHNIFGTQVTPRAHFKYSIDDASSLRATAGRGWRVPFYIAETQGMLVSGREIDFIGEQMIEDAWNYGGSYNWIGELFGMDADFAIDFYHTDFTRQFVTDRDADPDKIIYTMLDDAGYSNSFQTNIGFEPAKRMDVLLGYRYNDVRAQMGGELRQMPLMSPHMGFFNWEYATNLRLWTYDVTLAYHGPGRYPNNQSGLPQNGEYDGWLRVNAQITYDWEGFEIYLGGENLLDFQQPNAIIAADNPFSKQFDASQIWAPIFGRMIYTGFRYAFY
jgi:outer membrane receptor protein involved in Fe transport